MNERYELDGKQIRDYLRRGNLKHSHLVVKLGVSGSLVAQMLAGHVPQETTLEKLAQLMGVEVGSLLIPKESHRTA